MMTRSLRVVYVCRNCPFTVVADKEGIEGRTDDSPTPAARASAHGQEEKHLVERFEIA